jgi:hypothetical protein
MTSAHADPAAGFKQRCMRVGRFDGTVRNYYNR